MISYLFSFILGFSVKTIDLASEHGLKMGKYLKFCLSIFYGALMAFLLSIVFLPEFFFGIIIGVIVAGKIDSKEHTIALISFLVFSIFFPFQMNHFSVLFLSAIVCVFEEWINDSIVDKKKAKGFALKFLSMRPLLEMLALIISIIYSNFSTLFLLALFDSGYLLSKKFMGKKGFTKSKTKPLRQ
ncbi:MAG: hypothetical protein PHS81_02375 [Candidatus Nanoarchaeia archaeon]|nr:hypothetical protein [Candidatus Nanoarchaeia archaeon]